MYRDEKDAAFQQLELLRRESENLRQENAAMRSELLHVRVTPPDPSQNVYRMQGWQISPGARAALSHHRLTEFPVWASGLLHLTTFGLFSIVQLGLQHDRMPKVYTDDPSAGRSIGFTFIPYFNMYWIFFNTMRLADRINLQYRLRGLPDGVPRGFMVACAIMSVIPYVNLLIGFPIMWTIGVCLLQRAINQLAAMNAATAHVQLQQPAQAWSPGYAPAGLASGQHHEAPRLPYGQEPPFEQRRYADYAPPVQQQAPQQHVPETVPSELNSAPPDSWNRQG